MRRKLRPTVVLGFRVEASVYEIKLTHSIDAAHRVVGHEGGRGKCARLHGHTYTFEVECKRGKLDDTGFVVDFGAIKAVLNEWDHRTLLWTRDPLIIVQPIIGEPVKHRGRATVDVTAERDSGVVRLPFNPTSENMGRYLAERLNDELLGGLGCVTVTVSETPKSSSTWTALPAPAGREPW